MSQAGEQNTIGWFSILAFALGGGMGSVRIAAKRLDYELPRWLDVLVAVGSVALVGFSLILGISPLLAVLGVSPTSPWPVTAVYCIVSFGLVVGAGYLPARIPTKGSSSSYKTDWEPAVAESFFLYLDSFKSSAQFDKVKIIATTQGTQVARLIAQILKHYEWQVEVNAADGSHVFPATEQFRGACIRYRKTRRSRSGDIFGIVSALAVMPETNFFPEEDQFNFSQIEIGDVSLYYSGPQRFMNENFR